MGDSRHLANQRNVWRTVCSEPDYCKVGSKTVPFDSFATIDNKVRAARNVMAQQQPVYRMGDVHQGVQANAGKGLPSGTSLDQGFVRFMSGQDNVKVNGVPVVRHDSTCLINCNAAGTGGARGKVVTEQIGVAGQAAPGDAGAQKPNAELQALLDKAADKRSLWEKTRDGASGLWDSAKRIGQASLDSPGQTGIGVLKGLGNLPTDLWNLAVLGSKYTGPLSPAMQSQVMNQAALQAYQGGNTALANQLASKASEVMSSGYVSDLFTASNAAQQGGMIGSMLVPVGAVVKGASAVAKVAKGAKALDTVADAAKVAETADAAKLAKAAEVTKVSAPVETAKVVDSPGVYVKPGKLVPGSAAHKADRWKKYQERGGKKNYDQWSKQYDTNMNNYQVGAARESEYRAAMDATEGTLKTPLTNRQIDILKADEMYAGQLKTGPVSLTKENVLAIQKDAELVKAGWQVEHILERGASKPYLEALERGGIDYRVGPTIP